jgi:NAD(P)-dependent dehydrogenase (short-subunit alcohol dehydrogenase family)
MIDLSSFPSPFNVAIIGASGGIGKAFLEELEGHEQVGQIYSFSRNAPDTITLDLCDENSIKAAAAIVDKPLHLIILATGLLHDGDLMPEKSLRDVSLDKMSRVMAVNVIGPALVAKHFLPHLPREGKSIFAALSARVGSISDNSIGGWHSYRASKAALNMVLKNVAIETARKYKSAAVIGLHPGTVDTGLSAPFQSNVKDGKLFTSQQSAQYLLSVLNNANAESTGKIFAWDGQEIQP